ncbi:oocyte zinc finger protein XlCOF7.1-like [Oncorhynchus nerka]|uniref:oocyte zinc finger protein XlCOF7.1-like n=1 Tax=Oncorhynchus nerka TaxID=8023 RepID=UPI00113084B9|nr:oocyte zinc finger protein XlCOF7.1-like [Oncorhynchus nerka]
MANCLVFHTQIASIMEVLANTAVAEICKLVDDDYAVFRLEITQSREENRTLRRKLQLLELKVSRERVFASRPSSVKIVDRCRGMERGEGHLTGGHGSFVKPVGQNAWRDDQTVTVGEGSGTSTQHVIMIESAETAGPGGSSLVKQERSEGEEDRWHSRDIQTGVAAGTPPVATDDPTIAPAPPWTRSSGTLNAVLKSETDIKTLIVTQRLLHTGSDHRSDPERLGPLGCPTAPGSEYLPVFQHSQRMVHSHGDGDTLATGGDDLSCSYATEMAPGNMPLGLETPTDLSRGKWNRYSSSVYSEGCLDKKGEGLVIDEVTVKVEGDVSPTWNSDNHLGDGHSQDRDFLNYRERLETNPDASTHSPLHGFRDCVRVSTSIGPSDSHGRFLFDRTRPQAQGGRETSGSGKGNRFLCMFCNKGFSCPQKVEIHQRFHTGEKPFSCTQCHMHFAQAGDLKRHQRIHSGEKPYSCTQCEKRFSRQDHLKMHLKVHTGERPFACTHCGKRFSERSYLRIHQQKNHSTL